MPSRKEFSSERRQLATTTLRPPRDATPCAAVWQTFVAKKKFNYLLPQGHEHYPIHALPAAHKPDPRRASARAPVGDAREPATNRAGPSQHIKTHRRVYAARAGPKIAPHKLLATHLDDDSSTRGTSRTIIGRTATRFTSRNDSSNTPDECRTRSRGRRPDDRVRLASSRRPTTTTET